MSPSGADLWERSGPSASVQPYVRDPTHPPGIRNVRTRSDRAVGLLLVHAEPHDVWTPPNTHDRPIASPSLANATAVFILGWKGRTHLRGGRMADCVKSTPHHSSAHSTTRHKSTLIWGCIGGAVFILLLLGLLSWRSSNLRFEGNTSSPPSIVRLAPR
jgi:hypothetical protein